MHETERPEHAKEHKVTDHRLKRTEETIAQEEQLPVGKPVCLGIAWFALHEVTLCELVGEADGGCEVCAEVDGENHDDFECEGDFAGDEDEEGQDLWDV